MNKKIQIIAYIGLLSSVITIFVFFTGHSYFAGFLSEINNYFSSDSINLPSKNMIATDTIEKQHLSKNRSVQFHDRLSVQKDSQGIVDRNYHLPIINATNFLDNTIAREFVREGHKLNNKTDYIEAIDKYTRAIESCPHDDLLYHFRGDAKYSIKDFSGAIDDYTKAIHICPTNFAWYRERGRIKNDSKDYEGAIEDFDQSIKIAPDWPVVYYYRSKAYYGLKNYKVAIGNCDKAIQLLPNYADAFNARGLAKDMLKDNIGACQDFLKSCELGLKVGCLNATGCERK